MLLTNTVEEIVYVCVDRKPLSANTSNNIDSNEAPLPTFRLKSSSSHVKKFQRKENRTQVNPTQQSGKKFEKTVQEAKRKPNFPRNSQFNAELPIKKPNAPSIKESIGQRSSSAYLDIREGLDDWTKSYLAELHKPSPDDWDLNEITVESLLKRKTKEVPFVLGDREEIQEEKATTLSNEKLNKPIPKTERPSVRSRLPLATIEKLTKKLSPVQIEKQQTPDKLQNKKSIETKSNPKYPTPPKSELDIIAEKYGKQKAEIRELFKKCSENFDDLRAYLDGNTKVCWDSDEDFLLQEGAEKVLIVMERYKTKERMERRRQYLKIHEFMDLIE